MSSILKLVIKVLQSAYSSHIKTQIDNLKSSKKSFKFHVKKYAEICLKNSLVGKMYSKKYL